MGRAAVAVARIAVDAAFVLVLGLVGEAEADLDDGERRALGRRAGIVGLLDLAVGALPADRCRL
ncbi:MAG TPA: hypothetical protein PLC22_13765, partial [Gordonia sp. (in: high G+C Gram-positive bacteria)]|nr:hypothetical protein [Gordonia sp. (in: high G+C Gram-positive bacteria)]